MISFQSLVRPMFRRRALPLTIPLLMTLTLLLVILTRLVIPTAAQADTPTCVPAASPTRLAWFYNPPPPARQANQIENFDLYILNKGDESELQAIHFAGKGPVLRYLHFDSVHDPCEQARQPQGTPCACDQRTIRNQVAWKPTDICWIRDNHPEWFLRDIDGELLYNEGQVMIDPGNAEWQAFWLERVWDDHLEGWDGIFLDNLSATFGVHSARFVDLQNYPTSEAYSAAVADFMARMRREYFDPEGKLLYANISIRDWESTETLPYLDHLDGVMHEFWAYSRADYYAPDVWLQHFTQAEQVLARGKTMVMVAQGPRDDFRRQRYGLAAYLLLVTAPDAPQAYFRYTSDQGSYNEIWLYDNYDWLLGDPLGPYTVDGSLYRREFVNGWVEIDFEERRTAFEIYDATGGCE